MTEHLGDNKHDPAGAGEREHPQHTRSKTVLTKSPAGRRSTFRATGASTFETQIVRKRQRRLNGVDEVVLSLYAKGLTTGDISAHFAEIYGASVSKETISRITDHVIEEINDWSLRPLDARRFLVGEYPLGGGGTGPARRPLRRGHKVPPAVRRITGLVVHDAPV